MRSTVTEISTPARVATSGKATARHDGTTGAEA
jgi:hypothetical protein